MIDIHHHLLPGVDDGANDLDTSVAMAKLAVADGITHVVCSPHANSRFDFDPGGNQEKAEALRARLAAEGVPLTVGLGCDFHLSYENVQEALTAPRRFTINGGSYLLVELPDFGLPVGLTEQFHELTLAGMTPILTHPERNPTLQSNLDRIKNWLRGGVLMQVTADSVTGRMGRAAEKIAHQMLANRWVHIIASDAHNTTTRPPRMSEAHRIIEKKYGADYAHALCQENPLAAFEGGTVPPQVEPKNLYEDVRDRNWLERLLGR